MSLSLAFATSSFTRTLSPEQKAKMAERIRQTTPDLVVSRTKKGNLKCLVSSGAFEELGLEKDSAVFAGDVFAIVEANGGLIFKQTKKDAKKSRAYSSPIHIQHLQAVGLLPKDEELKAIEKPRFGFDFVKLTEPVKDETGKFTIKEAYKVVASEKTGKEDDEDEAGEEAATGETAAANTNATEQAPATQETQAEPQAQVAQEAPATETKVADDWN